MNKSAESINKDWLLKEYDQYMNIIMQGSSPDAALWNLVMDYEGEDMFNDMLFEEGSVVEDYVKYQYQDAKGVLHDDYDTPDLLSLDHGCYRFYVNDLDNDTYGQCDFQKRIITISPAYAQNKAVILHELIHAHESLIENSNRPYFHDIVILCLYESLSRRVPNLRDRIIDHTHIIHGEQITALGGSHDILFYLKSLDLDIRCGYKLGTVCGYGRDNFGSTTFQPD